MSNPKKTHMRDILRSPNKLMDKTDTSHPDGIWSFLLRSILHKLNVTENGYDTRLTRYATDLKESRKNSSNNFQRESTVGLIKGTANHEFAKSHITFSVFLRFLKVMSVAKVRLIVICEDLSGEVHQHEVEMGISTPEEIEKARIHLEKAKELREMAQKSKEQES